MNIRKKGEISKFFGENQLGVKIGNPATVENFIHSIHHQLHIACFAGGWVVGFSQIHPGALAADIK
jgi:hypothetical protein